MEKIKTFILILLFGSLTAATIVATSTMIKLQTSIEVETEYNKVILKDWKD